MLTLSPEKQLEFVRKNPTRLKEIENPTDEAKIEAVKIWPYVIEDIKNPSDAVQLAAVRGKVSVSSFAKAITSKSTSIRNLLALRLWYEFVGNVPEDFLSLFTGDALFLAKYGLLEKEVSVVSKTASLNKDQLYSLVKGIECCFPNPNNIMFRSVELSLPWPNWCLRSTNTGLSIFVRSLIWDSQEQVPKDVPAIIHEEHVVKSSEVGTEYNYEVDSSVYNSVCSVVSKYIDVPVHSISAFITGNPSSIKIGRSLKEKGAYDINVFINVNYV